MKYTLKTYGWSAEFIGKKLTDEQVKQIELLKEEKGYDELWQTRFDLDNLNIDIYDGDIFHVNKALDNDTMTFELEDENGNMKQFQLYDNISEFIYNFEESKRKKKEAKIKGLENFIEDV